MSLFRSIRVRLTLWYVLLLAIILAAFSFGVYFTLRHNLYANLDDSIDTRVGDLLTSVRYEDARPTLSGRLASETPTQGEEFVRVYAASEGLTFDNSAPAGDVAIDHQAVQEALAGKTSTRTVCINLVGKGSSILRRRLRMWTSMTLVALSKS